MEWIPNALASLIVAVIVIAIVVKLLDWLYVKSSGDMAFVRTGLGGSKVVRNGGALVIPVIHQTVGVSMNSIRIEVVRRDKQSLQTADHMRVNVQAAFYVHVKPEPAAIITAAATLGSRIQNGQALAELLEARLVDALRTVAAATEMVVLHADRAAFVSGVSERLRPDLENNGLMLESVSLIDFDQAGKEFFNPQNAFDAEGLTRLSREIEDRRRIRNEIERDTELAIQRKHLDVVQKQLEIEQHQLAVGRETEFARLQQQQDIAVRRAQQTALVAAEEARRRYEAQQAAIEATRNAEVAQVQAQEAVEQSRLTSELTVAEKRVTTQRETQLLEIRREQSLRVEQFEREAYVQAAEVAKDVRLAQLERERSKERAQTQAHEASTRELAEKAEIEAQRLTEEARITAQAQLSKIRAQSELTVKMVEIASATQTEQAMVNKAREIELVEQERIIAVTHKSSEKVQAQAEVDKLKVQVQAEVQLQEAQNHEEVELRRLAVERELALTRLAVEEASRLRESDKARDIELAAVERQRQVELAEQARGIAVSVKSRERFVAQVQTDEVRAKAAAAEAAVFAARQVAEAEAAQSVTTIYAKSEEIQAKGKADAQIVMLSAQERQYAIDAQGRGALVEADNRLSSEQVELKLRLATLERLPQIIAESARPMQEIDNLQVIQVEGLTGLGSQPLTGDSGGGGTVSASPGGNLAEQLMSSALRYRAQAPLVDSILKEVGLDGSSPQGLVAALQKPLRTASKASQGASTPSVADKR